MTRRRDGTWRWHSFALFAYGAGAWCYLDHGSTLTRDVLGSGGDPDAIMWLLAWWPWAATHHVHSLVTRLVWQPWGANLAWTTNVPLLALLVLPLTVWASPVLAYNVLTLAAPVFAAYAAFLLCLELYESPAAAAIGGWLFGFSSYENAENYDHVNLAFTALIPLAGLVIARRVTGKLERIPALLYLGVLIGCEFLIAPEIVATSALCGFFALLLGYWILPEQRTAVSELAIDLVFAAPVAVLVGSPIFFWMLAGSFDIRNQPSWPYIYSADLVNFLVPAPAAAIGGELASGISRHFSGAADEQAAYLGFPVLLFLGVAYLDLRKNRYFLLIYALLALMLVASLGPVLTVAGQNTGIILPEALLLRVPLLADALPSRYALYVSLFVAIILAGWIAAAADRRWLAGLIACVSLMPAFHPTQSVPDSEFFAPGRLEKFLGPQPRLLVLPMQISGPATYWQMENRFGYSQTGGYLGMPPSALLAHRVARDLYFNHIANDFSQKFPVFCKVTQVQYVVAGPGTTAQEIAGIAALGWPARQIDDVTVFTVPVDRGVHE